MKNCFIGIVVILFTACATSQKIKDGATAYQYKNYVTAADLLEKEYTKEKTTTKKQEIAKKLVNSYQYLQNSEKAMAWAKQLYSLNVSDENFNTYLQSIKHQEEYTTALTVMENYLQQNKSYTSKYAQELNLLKQIIKEQEQTTYSIKNLSNLNSSSADYGLFNIDNTYYFSSTRTADAKLKDNFTGNNFSSIWQTAQQNDSTFTTPTLFQIDKFPYHYSQITFSKDKTEAYFTQCGTDKKEQNDFCQIYKSVFFNAAWTAPKLLPLFSDTCDAAQPFLANNDTELYFTSNIKGGYGGSDVYIAKRDENGNFTQVFNLGNKINTDANECFPTYIDTTLYFASNRRNGYGGLDIYNATKKGTYFEKPTLLNYPINSGADDFYYLPQSTTISYFSSNRKNGMGKDDIYQARYIKPILPKLPKPPVYMAQIEVIEHLFEQENNPNSKIIAQKEVPNANVFIPMPIVDDLLTTDVHGMVTTHIHQPVDFKLKVYKEGYLSTESRMEYSNIKAKDGDTVILKQTIVLQKIMKNVEITLNNIYYDYDKSNIREDAKQNLDTLLLLLNQNPNIKIELASHTDCRGSVTYNQTLSQARAESVVNFLIQNGIDKVRLVAKGYGESKLLENCDCKTCTASQHQRNRRTTFKIID